MRGGDPLLMPPVQGVYFVATYGGLSHRRGEPLNDCIYVQMKGEITDVSKVCMILCEPILYVTDEERAARIDLVCEFCTRTNLSVQSLAAYRSRGDGMTFLAMPSLETYDQVTSAALLYLTIYELIYGAGTD